MAKDRKIPKLANNFISLIGIVITAVSALVMAFLYLIDLFAGERNPYVGIFLYMIMPVGLIYGLFLVPVGMYRQWRRWKKTGEISLARWPLVDLNRRDHRNATFIFLFGGLVFLEVTSIGASQVYATAADIFPRSIPTPIVNLRPAQETCEQCHWPEKFYGGQQKQLDHHRYEEENSHWPISLLIKTGDGDPRTGRTAGIHWHLNIGAYIDDFYQSDYPELYNTASHLVFDATEAVQEAFARNISPEMKVRWSVYPDNIGHFEAPGCMRCHSGNLVTEEGLAATNDCRACHIILAQGEGERAAFSTSSEGLDFDHPEDIDGAWQEMGCYECHTGLQT